MVLEVGAPRAGGDESGRTDERHHYRIFLLHHTHWDREWWGTFQVFRLQLVDLITVALWF